MSGGKGTRRERVREELGRGSEAWKELGECRGDDPTRWIGPDEGMVKESAAERLVREHGAKVVCAVCEVQMECRDWAIANKERGVWGGLTDRERRGLVWMKNGKPR